MVQAVFPRVEQRTVQGAVVDLVRDAIISGVLPPGERLTESTIAQQMNVSRAPLREALRQLEEEGLVVRQPNRGCSVVDLSEQDIQEIFSLRCTLECMAIEWATANLTPADFVEMHANIEDCRLAIDANDPDRLTRLDMQFHEQICARAMHGRLLKAWCTNNGQVRMVINGRFRLLSDYVPKTVISDHTRLLEAFESGDVAAAIALTQEINSRVTRETVRLLRTKRDAASHRVYEPGGGVTKQTPLPGESESSRSANSQGGPHEWLRPGSQGQASPSTASQHTPGVVSAI
jgi:DNA-binding GntR family transcriptional regulator